MSEKPKRPWFRFHLLTAVLMMVSAGLLLRANFLDRFSILQENVISSTGMFSAGWIERGWPFPSSQRVARLYKDGLVGDPEKFKATLVGEDWVHIEHLGYAVAIVPGTRISAAAM